MAWHLIYLLGMLCCKGSRINNKGLEIRFMLCCRHHPDHDHSEEAPLKFIAINEAYSLLMGKKRGKDVEEHRAGAAGWNFHDW